MIKKYLLLNCLLFVAVISEAQQQFIAKGKIEFERRINVHRQYDETDDNSSFFKEYISKLPRFNVTYFDMEFMPGKTIYKPGQREAEGNPPNLWGIGPAKENVVMTDLEKQEVSSLKKVFEQTYLVQDSLRKAVWKISNETRTIAGFECRKAVAKLFDSVYVVAFYTDEIAVSGGPETFNGLPGMILGLAIPRLYSTWFATKVELVEAPATDFVIKGRGKKITEKVLLSTLQSSFKDWGDQADKYTWWALL